MKTCSRCHVEKPFDLFAKRSASKDGCSPWCKQCHCDYGKETRDPEKSRAYGKAHYAANAERLRAESGKRMALKRQEDGFSEKWKPYWDARYQAKKGEINAKNSAWAERNRDRSNGFKKKYSQAHPEVAKACIQRRRARKTGAGGSYTAQQWKDLCDFHGNVCLCCRKSLPLSVDHVIPVKDGGTSDISNLQCLCLSCNRRKATKSTDYR